MSQNHKNGGIICALIMAMLIFVITCGTVTSPESNHKFHVSASVWDAPDSGGISDPIEIRSVDESIEYTWTIINDSGWLNVSPGSGVTPSEFTITADSNVTGLERNAGIEIVIDEKDVPSEQISISQHSKRGLIQVGHYRPPIVPRPCLLRDNTLIWEDVRAV